MATTRDRKDTTKMLLFTLEEILGPTGLNLLGTYDLVSGDTVVGTSPAIAVNYPLLSNSVNTTTTSPKNIVKKLQPESGIECIIQSDPDFVPRHFRFANRQIIKFFEIALDQYNPTEGLIEAVEGILRDKRLYIQEEPIFRPAILDYNNGGVLPPRALLYHQQTQFLESQWSS